MAFNLAITDMLPSYQFSKPPPRGIIKRACFRRIKSILRFHDEYIYYYRNDGFVKLENLVLVTRKGLAWLSTSDEASLNPILVYNNIELLVAPTNIAHWLNEQAQTFWNPNLLAQLAREQKLFIPDYDLNIYTIHDIGQFVDIDWPNKLKGYRCLETPNDLHLLQGPVREVRQLSVKFD